MLWNEVQAAAVDQPICEHCYDELREVLIDRETLARIRPPFLSCPKAMAEAAAMTGQPSAIVEMIGHRVLPLLNALIAIALWLGLGLWLVPRPHGCNEPLRLSHVQGIDRQQGIINTVSGPREHTSHMKETCVCL